MTCLHNSLAYAGLLLVRCEAFLSREDSGDHGAGFGGHRFCFRGCVDVGRDMARQAQIKLSEIDKSQVQHLQPGAAYFHLTAIASVYNVNMYRLIHRLSPSSHQFGWDADHHDSCLLDVRKPVVP